MRTPTAGANKDVTEKENEIFVMNFSDDDVDDEHFLAPMNLETDEYQNNDNLENHAFDCDDDIKLENSDISSFERTHENVFTESDGVAPKNEDVVGPYRAVDSLAAKRHTDSENVALTNTSLNNALLSSDSNDDGDDNRSHRTAKYVEINSDNTNATLYGEKSHSSIIITSVESVVYGSENNSLIIDDLESTALVDSLENTDSIGCLENYSFIDNSEHVTYQSEENATAEGLKSLKLNSVLYAKELLFKQTFKCHICPFSSKTRFSLSRHMGSHSTIDINAKMNDDDDNNTASQADTLSATTDLKIPKSYLFKCNFCSFSSKIRFALRRHHILTHANLTKKTLHSADAESSIKIAKCKRCLFVAKNNTGLANHVRLLHSGIITTTNALKKKKSSLSDKHSTNEYAINSSTTSSFKCKYCSFLAKNRTGLAHHLRITHKDKIGVKRQLCDKMMKQKNLPEHKYVCSEIIKNKDIPENQIEVMASEMTKLTNQIPTNSSNVCVSNCKYCSFVAKSKAGIVNHVRMIHKNVFPIYSSTNDNKESSLPDNFAPNTKIFKCKYCSFSSKIRFALRRHQTLIHTRKNTEEIFNSKSTRDQGASIYKNEVNKLRKSQSDTAFLCKFCSFSSDYKSRITQHTLLHTELKRKIHKCTDCDYSSTKYALSRHITSVHRLTMLHCEFCSYTSNQKVHIQRHTLLHTKFEQKIYKCKECNYKSTKCALSRHASERHGKYLGFNRKTGDRMQKFEPKQFNTNLSIFQCSYCSFSTKHAEVIPKHTLLHTKFNQKIEKCKHCNYRATKYALSRHTNAIHMKSIQSAKTNSIKTTKDAKSKDTEDAVDLQTNKPLENTTDDKDVKLSEDQLNRSRFQCTLCSHKSQNLSNFRVHLNMHKKHLDLAYQCKKYYFKTAKGLVKKHVSHFHRDINYKFKNEYTVGKNVKDLRQLNKNKRLVEPSTSEYSLSECLSGNKGASSSAGHILDFKSNRTVTGVSAENSQELSTKRHSNSDLSTVLYVCEICGYEAIQKDTLIAHKLTHVGTIVTIDVNEKRSDEKYVTGNKGGVPIKPKKTIFENNVVSKGRQARERIVLQHDKRQCCTCKRAFDNSNDLRNHKCVVISKLLKQDGSRFVCRKCRFTSDSLGSAKVHLLVHKSFKEAAIHTCLKCDYRTKYKSNLRGHIKGHNVSELCKIFKYSCDVCKFKTKTNRMLNRHKNYCQKLRKGEEQPFDISSNKTKYKCDSCDFQTEFKDNLQDHKIVHTNINEVRVYRNKTYNVKIMKKSSANVYSRAESTDYDAKQEITKPVHDNNHGNKMYRCDHCCYSSRVKCNLESHIVARHKNPKSKSQDLGKSTETGIKFSCTHCRYTTKFRFSLNMHINETHTKKMRAIFKCSSCSFTSNYKANLKRHVKNAHIENGW